MEFMEENHKRPSVFVDEVREMRVGWKLKEELSCPSNVEEWEEV